MKAFLTTTAIAAATAAFALVTSASASVVCNRSGECWHTDQHYRYGRDLGVTVHPDHWYFHQKWDNDHHWRDYHEGRGYYREGVWVPF